MMVTIPFTQYLRPDGRRSPVSIERPDPVVEKARAIIAAGFRFECEVLTTGEVSFSIADDEQDHAVAITKNGPEVLDAIDKMVLEFVIP